MGGTGSASGLPGLPKGMLVGAGGKLLSTGRPGEDRKTLPKVTLMEEDDF